MEKRWWARYDLQPTLANAAVAKSVGYAFRLVAKGLLNFVFIEGVTTTSNAAMSLLCAAFPRFTEL